MNESFYVVVATIAPVLLFGTALNFRSPKEGKPSDRLRLGYVLMFALAGIAGTSATLIAALHALMKQADLASWAEIGMFWSLTWLLGANLARIAGPFIEELEIVTMQSTLARWKRKNAKLRLSIEQAEAYSAELDASIEAAKRDGRLKTRNVEPTRLLASKKKPSNMK